MPALPGAYGAGRIRCIYKKPSRKWLPRLAPAVSAKPSTWACCSTCYRAGPDQMQVVARGAFSVTLQQHVMQSLSRCEFPAKTPNEPDRWNWVHCQVRHPVVKDPFELIMPDVAGEALLEEVEHPHSYVAIRSFLTKCAGAMILVDSTCLADGQHPHDYFTLKPAHLFKRIRQRRKNELAKSASRIDFQQSRPVRRLLRRSANLCAAPCRRIMAILQRTISALQVFCFRCCWWNWRAQGARRR